MRGEVGARGISVFESLVDAAVCGEGEGAGGSVIGYDVGYPVEARKLAKVVVKFLQIVAGAVEFIETAEVDVYLGDGTVSRSCRLVAELHVDWIVDD